MGTITDGLYTQFALRADEDPSNHSGWRSRRCGGWCLHYAEGLPVAPVLDNAGRTRGWLIGWALDGTRFVDGLRLPQATTDGALTETFASAIRTLAGRFAATLVDDPSPRFYLDPLGSLATVYRTDARVVASTPTAAHLDDLDSFVARCRSETELPANGYYLGNLTRTDDTRRLLPNFYLDLNTFTPHRHWPVAPIAPVATDAAAECVVEAIGDVLQGVASRYPIQHGLSAGRDTRLILAAARRRGVNIDWYTFNYNDPQKAGDVEIACRIAQTLGLRHRVLELATPTQAMRDAYLLRVGYSANAGKACDQYDGCLRHLNMAGAMGIGYGGEAGRGMYWRATLPDRRPDAPTLVQLLKLRHTDPRTLASAEWWLTTVPAFLSTAHVLDLAYLELRAGCWAMPQMYGAAPVACYFVPLCRADLKEAMMGMPEDVRRSQEGIRAMIRLGAGEVADLPFELPRRFPTQRRSIFRRGMGWLKRAVTHG